MVRTRGVEHQGHPWRERTASARIRPLSPAVTRRRVYRRSHLRPDDLADRPRRRRRRHYWLLRARQLARELRLPRVVPRLRSRSRRIDGRAHAPRVARWGTPLLDNDRSLEARVEFVRVIVEAARAHDIERSRGPALTRRQRADVVDRRAIDMRGDRIRTHRVRTD